MAVVTDLCPLRDPTRRAHEVAEEFTKAGHGLPLFQVTRPSTTFRSMSRCDYVANSNDFIDAIVRIAHGDDMGVRARGTVLPLFVLGGVVWCGVSFCFVGSAAVSYHRRTWTYARK